MNNPGEAIEDLHDLSDDLPAEERFAPARREGWYENADSVAVALHCLIKNYQEGRKFLEAQLSLWFAEDPEHWSLLHLVLLDPWHDPQHRWHEDTPEWLRLLSARAETVREKFGPYIGPGDVV